MKEVVCALIIREGKVMIVQHGEKSKHPWKWEFPGGKINPGEAPSDALIREIREELDIEIQVMEPLDPVIHMYDTSTILLIPFICHWKSGTIHLKEHSSLLWISPEELFNYDLLEADRAMMRKGENFILLRYQIREEKQNC